MQARNHFNTLTDDITQIVHLENNIEKKVRDIQVLVKSSIKKDGFILDAIELLLNNLENMSYDDWKKLIAYNHPKNLYSIRFILWPAYYSNNPHQHKTWSITAVIENIINVYAYKWENNVENTVLIKDRQFTGKTKEVGFLLPKCIHKLENPSSKPTLTMHIFNNLDQVTTGNENAIWFPSPEKNNLFLDFSKNIFSLFSNISLSHQSNRSEKIISKMKKLSHKFSDFPK